MTNKEAILGIVERLPEEMLEEARRLLESISPEPVSYAVSV